jgi:hypothetical protein
MVIDLSREKVTRSNAAAVTDQVVRSSFEDYPAAPDMVTGPGPEPVESAVDTSLAMPHPRFHGVDDEPDTPSAWQAFRSAP